MAASGAYAVLPRGVSFAADDAGCGLPVPSAAQRAWADMELGMLFHFDIPVYRPRWNWRTFRNFPDPKLYNPVKLDTDQWMESAKAFGVQVATETVGGYTWTYQINGDTAEFLL